MNTLKYILITIILVMFIQISRAHHAKEYLKTESYALAPKGKFILFNGFDYYKFNSSFYSWEFTPTLTYGITDRLMAGFHVHYYKNSDFSAPFIEAGAVALQYQITKPNTYFLDIAWITEFEFPFKKSRKEMAGAQLLINTLVLSKELSNDMNITMNLRYEQELSKDKKHLFEYNLGTKGYPVKSIEWLEAGLELHGSLGNNAEIYMTPGIYAELSKLVVLKAGVSIGLNDNSYDYGGHIVLALSL